MAPKPQANPKKPTKSGRKHPRGSGEHDYNKPIHPEVLAMVWNLTEEGLSQREIGSRLGISASAVSKEQGSDPVRLSAVRARQREERAKKWKQIENLGLDEVLGWLDVVEGIRTGTRKKLTKRELILLPLMPRFLQATRASAETASKMTQLLTGGATERYEKADADDAITDEQLIDQAIDLDRVMDLPPRLRAVATRRKGERA